MSRRANSYNDLITHPQQTFGPRYKSIEERFNNHIKKNGPISRLGTSCWEWTGWCSQHGYGQMDVVYKPGKKTNFSAHRISFILYKGNIPEGLDVLHECDNKKCVNPEHLKVGDDKQNVLDVENHGNKLVGEAIYSSKLSEKDVDTIFLMRKKGALQREIAETFNINQSEVSKILSGKRWGHRRAQ